MFTELGLPEEEATALLEQSSSPEELAQLLTKAAAAKHQPQPIAEETAQQPAPRDQPNPPAGEMTAADRVEASRPEQVLATSAAEEAPRIEELSVD